MPKLFRHMEKDGTDKFLVIRRDGTVPRWPYFVIGARDPYAEATLRAYANEVAKRREHDKDYVESVRKLADQFATYRKEHGNGDPEAPKHRPDDSRVISAMKGNSCWIKLTHERK